MSGRSGMALSAKLQIRQSQSLVITPQLMQAIRLLQMSTLELERFVASEIEANPLLCDGEPEGASDGDNAGTRLAAPGDRDASLGEAVGVLSASAAFAGSRQRSPVPDRIDTGAEFNLAETETLVTHLERRMPVRF